MDHLEHENLYRGEGILKNRDKISILLCGGGALGSWLSDLLSRQGYHSLTIIDFDKVEKSNFGTQNFGKQDIGRLKSDQIRLNIHRRIGIKINSLPKKVTSDNVQRIIKGYNLIVDLFDNGESRECLRSACKKSKIACLHSGLAAMGYFEIKWNEKYKSPPFIENDDNIPCEYPMASNLVMMCVSSTAEVINRFVDFDEKINIEFWLKNFGMEVI